MNKKLRDNTDYERLRVLYSVLAGLPDSRVDLGAWKSHRPNDCGSIACAGGWAAMYPPFRELGLLSNSSGTPLMCGTPHPLDPRESYTAAGTPALSRFFGLKPADGAAMFDVFGEDPKDWKARTHRQAVMARILRFLCREGAITKERRRELMKRDCRSGS